VFMLSERMWLIVRWSVVRMTIVPHDPGAYGKSFCITMRLTLRKGGIDGACRF
jgi:hypothetical protein